MKTNCDKISVFWFRRDLRLDDNVALYHVLQSGNKILPIFIFDENILNELKPNDLRVNFIHNELTKINAELAIYGSKLQTFHGDPIKIWEQILTKYNVSNVFFNNDYEPYAIARDSKVKELLKAKSIDINTYKDHVVFEANEVLKTDAKPYTVFTPYKNKWLEKFKASGVKVFNSHELLSKASYFTSEDISHVISLESMGFEPVKHVFPNIEVPSSIIKNYDKTRDIPGIDGTSRLGIHYRFGTISIREKAAKAAKLNQTYLNELIWRDFYQMIIFHFPHVVTSSFRTKYDEIKWINNVKDFELWKSGKTGYPLVDAGMRELNKTGYMHNRVRMLVASFLTKHLLIDWRWGEAYFAEKLLDFDLASNNGGWQWAAGCGTDAAPYFRIFNPTLQLNKFDPKLIYVKKWVPEYGSSEYPKPIIDHKEARERCLKVYKAALN
jgi:deoxyribodipyrimidine photo-lyase